MAEDYSSGIARRYQAANTRNLKDIKVSRLRCSDQTTLSFGSTMQDMATKSALITASPGGIEVVQRSRKLYGLSALVASQWSLLA